MGYNKDRELVSKARVLRNNMTRAEIILWSRLREKKINGYKFRRQQPIFDYIVDFYCPELKLIIEVDGEIHSLPEKTNYDSKRDNILKINGYHIIRLTNLEIETELDSTINKIILYINEILPPPRGTTGGHNHERQTRNTDFAPLPGGPQQVTIMKNNIEKTILSPSQGDHRGSSYKSSVIHIGSIPLGGDFPIRLQSMTNTDTLDTKASVAQCIRIIEAGADYVRLTAQGIREAKNLAVIKKEIRKAGFDTPLIADIHFNPAAAETAARLVEKVRINPGNYTDKRASFEIQEFTDKEYNEELERIHSKLFPLIKICHEHKTVIRIGINHGSLSDRIMTRFGNTPEGMVNSALEFIRIFRAENFNDLVLSMKSSNTAIMIEATRMLVKMMQSLELSYPLHIGVTEAGEGEDGRVRSSAGIGALLAEGLGDTIRVSLSEYPEKEIPVAAKLAAFFPRGISSKAPDKPLSFKSPAHKPEILRKINGPLVVSNMTSHPDIDESGYINAGYDIDPNTGEIKKTDGSADLLIVRNCPPDIPADVSLVVPYKIWADNRNRERLFPLFSPETFHISDFRSEKLNVLLTVPDFNIEYLKNPDPATTLVIFTFLPDRDRYAADHFLNSIEENNLNHTIVLNPVFRENNIEDLQIKASSLLGRYILDKRVAGISIKNTGDIDLKEITALAFSILQCTETRITRTMFLSCPTCGRTKFNLQDAVKKVKEATGHLKGLKIAVMGCIVNGPGEMAGADYGYVGTAAGKVHIYKGTVPVLKNVPEKDAVAELLKVIENDNRTI